MRVKAGTSSSLCSKAKRQVGISERVYQRLRKIGYGRVPDFFCCSAKHRQQINCHTTNPRPAPTLQKTALSLSLFVGERARSSRCIEPLYSRNHCKRTIIPRHTPNPSKSVLSLENRQHPCLPCQREVD